MMVLKGGGGKRRRRRRGGEGEEEMKVNQASESLGFVFTHVDYEVAFTKGPQGD